MSKPKQVTEEEMYLIEEGVRNAFGNPKVHYHWVHEDVQRLAHTIRHLWDRQKQLEDEVARLKHHAR